MAIRHFARGVNSVADIRLIAAIIASAAMVERAVESIKVAQGNLPIERVKIVITNTNEAKAEIDDARARPMWPRLSVSVEKVVVRLL
jgi:hypothetical protein